MRLYLDASALIAILTNEASRQKAFDAIRATDLFPLVSDFCRAECSATLAKLVRTNERSQDEVDLLYLVLDRWAQAVGEPTVVTATDVDNATLFIRRRDLALRAPDAIHIASAHRLGATLLTLDRGMARAAAALGVPCLNPAEVEAPGEPKD